MTIVSVGWRVLGFIILALFAATVLQANTPGAGDRKLALAAPSDSLDLDDLSDRIANTKAIGVLSKLSMKRDVDTLEKDLRAFHKGGASRTLEQLRERYDLMVHNLLVQIQDKDAELAKDVARVRDDLWKRLADPDEFDNALG